MTLASDRPDQSTLQLLPKPVSFDEFIAWYPENSELRYELRRGVIVPMPKPRGEHSEVGGNTAKKLNYAIDAAGLPYLIPRECVVKCSDNTGYEPDVVVLDRAALEQEPRWQTASTVEHGASIKLIVEVVSTNWQDDYELKMAAYEAMGIPEYWLVDYAGLGGVRHIGKPKQPTLSICTLVNDEYEIQRLRGEERMQSPTFPELNLIAAQILTAGR